MELAGKASCNEKVAYTASFSSLPLSLLSFKNTPKPCNPSAEDCIIIRSQQACKLNRKDYTTHEDCSYCKYCITHFSQPLQGVNMKDRTYRS